MIHRARLIAVVLASAAAGVVTQSDAQELTPLERHKLGRSKQTETAALFSAHSYKSDDGDSIPYRLLKPLNYDPEQEYPLVVCLSGSGGRGDDNVLQIGGCWPAQVLAQQSHREDYPCFVLAPQCPTGQNWVSIDSLVFAMIRQVEDEYSVDTDRRYVTGQSMGGSGSWNYIATHPDMFAAAVPICGRTDTTLSGRISRVPVWAFHGEQDDAVPVDFSRSMIAASKAAGGSPRYTEFPGVGHVSWPLAYDTPGLLDWLFAQKRHGAASVMPAVEPPNTE